MPISHTSGLAMGGELTIEFLKCNRRYTTPQMHIIWSSPTRLTPSVLHYLVYCSARALTVLLLEFGAGRRGLKYWSRERAESPSKSCKSRGI